MNYQKTLVHFMVVLALVGFIASSLFMFFQSFAILEDGKLPENYMAQMNIAVIYLTNGLTALVGGIVAAAFGISQSANQKLPSKGNKLQALGALTHSAPLGTVKDKSKYGFFYALAYIIMGITAVVLWIILEGDATQGITTMATSFLGMMIPIVASFFSGTN